MPGDCLLNNKKRTLKTRDFSFSLNSSSFKTHVSPVLWALPVGSFDDSETTCCIWFWLLFQNLTKNTHFGVCRCYKTFRLHSVIAKLPFYGFPFPLRFAPPPSPTLTPPTVPAQHPGSAMVILFPCSVFHSSVNFENQINDLKSLNILLVIFSSEFDCAW